MKSAAFSMFELVIVIVVVGILSAVIVPRLERDSLREATSQVVRHIQYTQHLAMVDDVYDDSNATWYKAMWRISFRGHNCYVVSSNTDHNSNYDRSESAIDPLTKTLLYSNTDCAQDSTDNSNMFLEDQYGIDSITFNSACGNNRFIAFDYLGRPHKTLSSSNDLVSSVCKITLHSGTREAVISITQETGYVKVL